MKWFGKGGMMVENTQMSVTEMNDLPDELALL